MKVLKLKEYEVDFYMSYTNEEQYIILSAFIYENKERK
jgi:hypothetical protein